MDPEIAGAGCGEQQPLLPKKHRLEEPEEATHKLQLTALCSARLVDPVTYTQAFPYVNALVAGLGITDDPSKVGLYSGLVESSFTVSQLFAIYHWARISDKIGRRPVILIGLAGTTVTTTFFGLSRTLATVLASRFLAGLFSGNVAVMQAVLAEITTKSNQATAMSIYGLVWPVGCVIGPLIGGTFSDPATRFPRWFSHEFFRMYPYFVPSFITSSIAAFGFFFAYLFLNETFNSRSPLAHTKGPSCVYGTTESEFVAAKPPTVRELLSNPAIRSLCTSASTLNFLHSSFDVVFVLFCYSPIKGGGLAFSTSHIGYSMAMSGLTGALIQLFLMRFLLNTFDHIRMYHCCLNVWPWAFAGLPVLNMIARIGLNDSTSTLDSRSVAMIWVGIAVILTLTRVGCLAYSLNMILLKDNASPSSLGITNGLVQISMCAARAFSPCTISTFFALSVDHHLLGGYFWVFPVILIWYCGTAFSDDAVYRRT